MAQTVEVILGRSIVQTKQCLLSGFYCMRSVGVITEYLCNFVELCGTLHCLIPFSVLWISQVIVTLIDLCHNQDGMDKHDH